MAETSFRVGLLGHGTVGAAFEALLGERAGAVAATTGLRPEISGVLTRSRGDFDEILQDSDLVVELIGGIDPARDYVLRAMKAGRHVVSANKQLLSQYGEELWPASCPSSASSRSRSPPPTWSASTGSSTARPTTSSPRWPAAASPTSRRSCRPRSSATPRPTRPTTSPAATPPPRWRSSPASR